MLKIIMNVKKKIVFIICVVIACLCNCQNSRTLIGTIQCLVISDNSYFASPHGIKSYYDYAEGLECSKISEKPYLVYFSGHGSLQSREMENHILSDKKILKFIKKSICCNHTLR